jgi:hypothetical protein
MIPIQFTNADDRDYDIDHYPVELPAIPAIGSFLTLDGKPYRVGYADYTIWSHSDQCKVKVSLHPLRSESN